MARQLFRLSFVEGKLSDERVRHLMGRMKESRPRNFIGVLEAYSRLLRLEVGKRHAVIESADELDVDSGQEVLADLKVRFGSDLTTEFRTNPDLIGGMRIQVGSHVWDGSVRNRLDRLNEKL